MVDRDCRKCENSFPETKEFFYFLAKQNRFRRICKKCFALQRAQYCINNKEKLSLYDKEYHSKNKKKITLARRNYYINNLSKRMFARAHFRALKKEIEFNITLADITIPERCPILDIPLFIASGSLTGGDNSPSLDRIDNNNGYVKGNVIVISNRANCIKRDASIEELVKITKFYSNYFKLGEFNV